MSKNPTEADEKAAMLREKIAMREKQLQDLAETVTEFNERLNQALLQNREYDAENRKLTKELEVKMEILSQELRDKEINFAKLQTLERENEKLKEQLAPKKEIKQAPPKKIFTSMELQQQNTHSKIDTKPNGENSSNLYKSEQEVKLYPANEEEEKTPENETEEELLERIRKNLNLAE